MGKVIRITESQLKKVIDNIINEQKPGYKSAVLKSPNATRYEDIQNFDHLKKLGLSKDPKSSVYIGSNNNVIYKFIAKGPVGYGSYTSLGEPSGNKGGSWKFGNQQNSPFPGIILYPNKK